MKNYNQISTQKCGQTTEQLEEIFGKNFWYDNTFKEKLENKFPLEQNKEIMEDFFNKIKNQEPIPFEIAKVIEENFMDLLATSIPKYSLRNMVKDLKEYTYLESQLHSIDFAKTLLLNEHNALKTFKENFNALIKTKYQKEFNFNFHTSCSINNGKIYSIRVWCMEFFNKDFKTIFELEYDGHTQKFKRHSVFTSKFNLAINEDNKILLDFNNSVNELSNLFESEMNKLINKETPEYELYHQQSQRKKEIQTKIETYLSNMLNEEENNNMLFKEFSKYFDEKNRKLRVNLFADNEYAQFKFKDNIEYKVGFFIQLFSHNESIGITYSHDNYKTLGHIECSLSNKKMKFNPDVFTNQKLMSKKISTNTFMKKKFFPLLLKIFKNRKN